MITRRQQLGSGGDVRSDRRTYSCIDRVDVRLDRFERCLDLAEMPLPR